MLDSPTGTHRVRIVEVTRTEAVESPDSPSEFEDWGEIDPRARPTELLRWLIEADGGSVVGDLSAHPVYHGPTAGSRAMNIGITVLEAFRGRGIGTIAQRLLAEELHLRGVIRVEASTDVRNLPEQRALAKAGFVMEGVLRRAQGRRDGIHDLQLWSHIE